MDKLGQANKVNWLVLAPKDKIILAFPDLGKDRNFKITSEEDHSYNCIAWAGLKNNIFWWPHPQANILDGIEWPFNLPLDQNLETFTNLYENLGYSICNSWEFEDQFQKIAIYVFKNNCTHAARQNYNGLWTSKLGRYQDICHTDPYSLINSEYGEPVRFMKRGNSSYDIRKIKKGIDKNKS